jgi:hypothetical protein
MNTIRGYSPTKVKPKRKLAITLAVSAPVIFLIISLFNCFVPGKEKTHVQ